MKKSVLAIALLMTLAMTLIPVSAQTTTESTFVAMSGRVTYYGPKPAYGCLRAFAEVKKWAEVKIIWTDMGPHILSFPVTYYFYAAKLVKSDIVELKYDGKDFYVHGLWDVWNVTLFYDGHGRLWKWIVTPIVDDEPGDLSVFNGWTDFIVDIKPKPPMELIAGKVLRYWIKPSPIPQSDCTLDSTIDIYDLVHVARAYRNTPGVGSYMGAELNIESTLESTLNTDLNLDFAVDIYDLTTVAANLGESY